MSYHDLLNIRYKLFFKILLIVIIMLLFFIKISFKEVYDVYNCYGYIINKNLMVNIPIDNPDTINKLEYIKVNDVKYDKNIINISPILLDQASLTNYQEITMDIAKNYAENQVLKVTFYYNKEKVLKKIQKLFL